MALKKIFNTVRESDVSRKPNTAYAKENFDHISYQGEHRLARGKSFFKNAQNKATELDIIMNWDLMAVPTKMVMIIPNKWFLIRQIYLEKN